MLELLQNNLIELVTVVFTALATTIGLAIKNAYIKYIDTKTKKEIVQATVEYVEQICRCNITSSEDKFNKAKLKAIDWLSEKGIKISDTELEVMIESVVNGFNKAIKVDDPQKKIA